MKKLMIGCLAVLLPMPSVAGNLQWTCTAFDLEEGTRLEAFCVERPRASLRNPRWYPIGMMRRTSIDLDQCVGEDANGNLVFGDQNVSSQCHSIGFNQTKQGPMLYATCRDDAGFEVDSIPLDLSVGLSSEGGQLVCSGIDD
ncbi:CVNH domain-containing protein [uncultured Thiohalocapsa sp.]|uniref:CVNH domain-containing protein n=1 Tax=uncultured Thiohalocapsa sp. TaxID=768990 RepID=UPI0025E13F43|nr:CVNH domain-containing protein [uncultured Thiohalocapsa sp.]